MSQLSIVHTAAFQGLDALPVDVETDITSSQELYLTLVGLPSTSVKESKDRVIAALRNSRQPIQNVSCTINLAPADLKKEGSFYDFPMALGLLGATGVIRNTSHLRDFLVVGELGLSGELRPIRGTLAIAMLARNLKKTGVVVPRENSAEAAAVPGISVLPVEHLNEAIDYFRNPDPSLLIKGECNSSLFEREPPPVDFSDVKGQEHVKRAMEIAAAGGHNVVLYGPPGTGKTMLSKALLGILPELDVDEALEITKIHSIAGTLPPGKSLVTQRPFRSPHHTISYAGLIGGGTNPRPGEVTLAHHGVLFLDELPEFSRTVLEVLRQPLEDRVVTISRANGHYTYPTNLMCIAAMNPCPCGYLGHPDKPCRDTEQQIYRYKNKISGPLWDRIDLHIEVPALSFQQLNIETKGESSVVIRERVNTARKRQYERQGKRKTNALLDKQALKTHASLDNDCRCTLAYAIDTMGISARACDRLTKVARTIADLEGSDAIKKEHLLEALTYRKGD